ncbi:hypothetical protein [Abyssogena phaseoliformis symbiont]|uniref:hypothetical protein n=1 Tax=Abyssogena phaseoliformis symbiont TaxID=596095 RepID=UPI0019155F89|nr:hypothetical protein [Abyssogena phaseoliformis symbiont]MBW5289618.1 hypothetical protein [Candidatus Ruthia sp. Apha_13_S6]
MAKTLSRPPNVLRRGLALMDLDSFRLPPVGIWRPPRKLAEKSNKPNNKGISFSDFGAIVASANSGYY